MSFLCKLHWKSLRSHFLLVAVQGLSVSAIWFSLLDNGTNYCNLHNVWQPMLIAVGITVTLTLSIWPTEEVWLA